MKRFVNYIKDLFGADVRLRMWCVENANNHYLINQSVDVIEKAERLYKFVKRGELPEDLNSPRVISLSLSGKKK